MPAQVADDMLSALLFFFFQAEDGIRDTSVTGVQTCALPISAPQPLPKELRSPPVSQAVEPVWDSVLHLPSLRSFLSPHFFPPAGTTAVPCPTASLWPTGPSEAHPTQLPQPNREVQARPKSFLYWSALPAAPTRPRDAATRPSSTKPWPSAIALARNFQAPRAARW